MDIFHSLPILCQIMVAMGDIKAQEVNTTSTSTSSSKNSHISHSTEVVGTQSPSGTLHNVDCGAHEHVVLTGLIDEFPYYVKVHRCHGATGSISGPERRICVPSATQSVTFHRDRDYKEFHIDNHTRCHYRCKHDNSSCSRYEAWDEEQCLCSCTRTYVPCRRLAEWDRTLCKYRCKYNVKDDCEREGGILNETDCSCKDPFFGTGYTFLFGTENSFKAGVFGVKDNSKDWENLCGNIYDSIVGRKETSKIDDVGKALFCDNMLAAAEKRKREYERKKDGGFFESMIDIKVVFIVACVEPIVLILLAAGFYVRQKHTQRMKITML